MKCCDYQGWMINPRIFPGSVSPGSLLLSPPSSATSARISGWWEPQNSLRSVHSSSQWSSSSWLCRKISTLCSVWNCLTVISDLFSLQRSSTLLLNSSRGGCLPSHKAGSPTEIWLRIFEKSRTEENISLLSSFRRLALSSNYFEIFTFWMWQ